MELDKASSLPVVLGHCTSVEVRVSAEPSIESGGRHGYPSGSWRLICDRQQCDVGRSVR